MKHTAVGLGDPNDHPFLFSHCARSSSARTCFHVVINPYPNITENRCQRVLIQRKQLENHLYTRNEALLYEISRENQVLISTTDNLIPHFVKNLLQYLQ